MKNSKKVVKNNDKNIMIEHIKKYIINDGETYLKLKDKTNLHITEILSNNINYDIISKKSIIVEYIRFKLINKLTNNSFGKNSPIKLENIKKILDQFIEDANKRNDIELLNELIADLFGKIKADTKIKDNLLMISEVSTVLDGIKNNISYLDSFRIDHKILNILHQI